MDRATSGNWRFPAVTLTAGFLLALLAILLASWSKSLLRSERIVDCGAQATLLSQRFYLELEGRMRMIERGRRPAEAYGMWWLNAEGVVRADPEGSAPPARALEIARTLSGVGPQPILDQRAADARAAHWIPAASLQAPAEGVIGVLVSWDVARVEGEILEPLLATTLGDYEAVVMRDSEVVTNKRSFHLRGFSRPAPPFAFMRIGVGLRDLGRTRRLIRLQTWLLGLLAVWLLIVLGGSLLLYARRGRRAEVRLRAREQFLARAYHELQTPLALMRAAAETVGRGAAERPQDVSRCIDIILREEERLTRTVRRLLRYLRLESAPDELLERGSLKAEVERVVEDCRPAIEAQGLTLEVDLSTASAQAQAPRDLVADALAELLANARKHAAGGSRVRVSLTTGGERSRLVVEDDGPGIGDVDPGDVFKAWGGQAKAAQATGSGLGLTLVRDGLSMIGGTIRCEAPTGGGARFIIELPGRS